MDKFWSSIMVLTASVVLSACGSTPSNTESQPQQPIAAFIAESAAIKQRQQLQAQQAAVQLADSTNELRDSESFLPAQGYDLQGNRVPYSASPNPYLQQQRVIASASVKRFISARRAYKAGDMEGAEKILLQLQKDAPALSGSSMLLAAIAEGRADHDAAIVYYRQAISVNPENVNAYLRLALIQRQQGQFIAAQNSYVAALTLWPDYPEAHCNLAILYDLYLNKPERALKHLQAYQFLTLEPTLALTGWLEELQQRTGISDNFIDPRRSPAKASIAPSLAGAEA